MCAEVVATHVRDNDHGYEVNQKLLDSLNAFRLTPTKAGREKEVFEVIDNVDQTCGTRRSTGGMLVGYRINVIQNVKDDLTNRP